MNKLKTLLINYAKKNPTFRIILRKILITKNKILYLRYYFNKTNEKMVVFESFMGRSYTCSPKALFEFMKENEEYKDYEMIWVLNDVEKSGFDTPNIRIVKYKSKEYFEVYSKAKYWITNSRVPAAIMKKNDQVYVQCWHGTPLKRLGYDIIPESKASMNSLSDMKRKNDIDAKRYDYFLSPSPYASEKFRSSFNLPQLHEKDIVLEVGYPRNDFLMNYKEEDVINIKTKLGIPEDKKVILYAPTWRDNQHDARLGYTYKTEVDFDLLQEKLSDEYVILFRAHYFIANSFQFDQYKDFIYDVSKIDDINELYIISDVLITDYSSVFFDYANLKRPMLFYMYDLDQYSKELRGFYIELSELPGPIIKTTDELIESIFNINSLEMKYSEQYKVFNDKYNPLDDGKASLRVIDKIIH